MITLVVFILLEYFIESYSGWLFVLPVLMDLALIARVGRK